MIRLGKLTDYAIVVMAQLSRGETAVPRSAHYLSSRTGVPEPTVAKILKSLSKNGMLESMRGASGGYRLVKPANDTLILEIITAMDGPVQIVSCVDGAEGDCVAVEKCPVKGNWDKVNDALISTLSQFMLSDMMVSPCGKTYDVGAGKPVMPGEVYMAGASCQSGPKDCAGKTCGNEKDGCN
ncbi:MAG: SUF system Fe-S cluster assembly regulator [Alphaproteobacteria bacterium]|nr:SUF system Fe-S cluster assembly regulator [Alphaproteobacteria bacterium]